MNALSLSKGEGGTTSLGELAEGVVTRWSDLCQQFLDLQRKEILEAEPSARKLQEHRAALKLMLRFGRAIYLTVADPDYPDKRIASEVHGRLLQLEHSWRIVHDPMSEAEADTLLGQVFPE